MQIAGQGAVRRTPGSWDSSPPPSPCPDGVKNVGKTMGHLSIFGNSSRHVPFSIAREELREQLGVLPKSGICIPWMYGSFNTCRENEDNITLFVDKTMKFLVLRAGGREDLGLNPLNYQCICSQGFLDSWSLKLGWLFIISWAWVVNHQPVQEDSKRGMSR